MSTSSGKMAMLVGGGPAPGINGVISAATIEARNHGTEVIGFQDGFQHLMKGEKDNCRSLRIEDVKDYALRGGSMLGTSRANPTKNEQDLNTVLRVLNEMGITELVTIGGDDTAFSASQLYKRGQGSVRVAHVPKTIDNDLPLPGSTPTFGFETARQVGVAIVRNLAEDARTTSRWYLVISMGRAAGFLAVGIGKASAATLTIIPEEYQGGGGVSLDEVCDQLVGAIIKRRSQGSPYGVAVLAEGLLEAIGEKGLTTVMTEEQLSRYGKVERDPHGHLRLGEIEFGRMVKDRVSARLKELKVPATLIDKDLGYELRCADPIPFDAEYTRDLGYAAVKFLRSEASRQFGAIISVIDGRMVPLRFEDMIVPTTGRMRPRKVNVEGEAFECARRYMIRLEKSDFEDAARLARLAAAANLDPQKFQQRFGYLVGLGDGARKT